MKKNHCASGLTHFRKMVSYNTKFFPKIVCSFEIDNDIYCTIKITGKFSFPHIHNILMENKVITRIKDIWGIKTFIR